MMRRLWITIGLLLALAAPLPSLAHKPSDSYLSASAASGEDQVRLRWDIALRDLDHVLDLDQDGDGELTWGEVRLRETDIYRYATERLQIASAGQACALRSDGHLQLDRHSDGTYAVVRLLAVCERLFGQAKLRYDAFFDVDPTHRGLIQWTPSASTQTQALVATREAPDLTLSLGELSWVETVTQYVWEGVWHIWIGFDHILFLLCLLLPAVLVRTPAGWESAGSLRASTWEVLKVVTAFTLAHSITLSMAALEWISLPSRLVESTIAASVVFAALNNLRGTIEGKRWVMAFGFGLIHGFGFASVLSDLGLPSQALLIALLGFNAGVELGQLAIVLVFLPIAFALRHTVLYRRGVMLVGSGLIALLAAWWFVQRAFDLQ